MAAVCAPWRFASFLTSSPRSPAWTELSPPDRPHSPAQKHPSDSRASASEPAARKQSGSHQGSRSCWTPTRPSRRRPRRRSSRRTARRRPAARARCACERRTGEADSGAAALAPLRRTKQAAFEEKGKQRTWRETYAASSSPSPSAYATDATSPKATAFIMATSERATRRQSGARTESGERRHEPSVTSTREKSAQQSCR